MDAKRAPWGRRFRAESGAQVAAGLLTCAVLALGAVTLAFDSHFRHPQLIRIDPLDVSFYGPQHVITHLSNVIPFFDSRGQTIAHVMMLGLVGLLTVALASLPVRFPFAEARRRRWTLEVVLAALAAAILWQAAREPSLLRLALGAPLVLVLWKWSRPLLQRRGNGLFLAAGLLALAAATLPALLQRLDLSDRSWSRIVFVQYHYSAVLGTADQLYAGRRLFSEVFPNYGSLLPVTAAAIQRRAGQWSMGDYLRVLQALQAVYLALAAWLYHRHARGRWVFVLPALLLVLPWYHFAQRGLQFPNHTPWRAIAVPAAVALLLLLERRGLPLAAFVLGAAGVTSLLLNFETGFAIVAGLGVYLVFRNGLRRGLPGLAGLAFLGASLALGLFLLAYRLALGHSVDLAGLVAVGWRASRLGLTGWNGLPLTAVTWPALVFGQAVFVLLYTARETPPPASPRVAFRAFVATSLLVWFAYFAYRPSEEGLSSYYLLYGFLVIDGGRYLVREVFARRRLNPLLAFGLAASFFLVLPRIVVSNAAAGRQAWGAVAGSRRDPTRPGRVVSGLRLPQPGADDVVAKSAYVRKAAARGRPIYFTADLYLVPKVSGVLSSGLPLGLDLEMITRDDYGRILADLVSTPCSEILFDAPGSEAERAALLRSFFQQIRRDVSLHFHPVRVEAGWEVWERIRPGPGVPGVQTASAR